MSFSFEKVRGRGLIQTLKTHNLRFSNTLPTGWKIPESIEQIYVYNDVILLTLTAQIATVFAIVWRFLPIVHFYRSLYIP